MAEGKAYRYVCGRTDIQAAQMSGFSQPDPGGDGRLPSYKRNSIPAKERKKKKWEEDKVPTCTSRILEPSKRKKENGQPKGGMGGRHAATTQGF